MTADNPFAPPLSDAAGPGSGLVGEDAWAEGDILVTTPTAILPPVCVRCGTEAGVTLVRHKGQWAPLWARLTVLLSPIVFLIVFLIVRKKFDVSVGLCPAHKSQRMLAVVGGWGALGLGLVTMFGGVFLIEVTELGFVGMLAGIVLLIGGVIGLVFAMPLKIVKVDAEQARFKGAHASMLQRLRAG